MLPLYLLIALQVADLVTTVLALRGKAVKSNPIVKKVMDLIGVVPALLLLKGIVIALFIYYQDSLQVEIVWILCLVYVAVVINNIQVIRKNP